MTEDVDGAQHLSDGVRIPALGFGTYPMDDVEAREGVRDALAAGYRLIDTAASYGNERGVGAGLRDAGVPREEVFVTTKLRGADQGRRSTRTALEGSLRRLGLDYLDLYLIHWPLPRRDLYVESWAEMVALRQAGLVRSIGVSNFTAAHLDRLEAETGVLPSVNQVELHPHFPQRAQRSADAERSVLTESWSPLGRGGAVFDEPAVTGPASAHGVTAAQVVLRWHLQLGVVPIPKSSSPERRRANLDVFGFALTGEEMAALSALDRGRSGGDPDTHEEF